MKATSSALFINARYSLFIYIYEPYYFVENAGKCISRTILAEQEDPNRRILVLFTSWGISGALIQDGRILNGRDSLIGEIGHMILDPTDTEQCTCGSFGCLERLVSIARLRKRIAADKPPASSPLATLAPESINLHHLFFASRREGPYARGSLMRLRYLSCVVRASVERNWIQFLYRLAK